MTEDVQTRFSNAVALQQAGQTDTAKIAYRRILDVDPNHVATLVNLANLLADEPDLDAALVHCERALETAPEDPRALRSAGLLHLKRGDTPRAQELLLAAASRDPGNAETLPIRFTPTPTRARMGANRI